MNLELLNIFFYLIPLFVYWKKNRSLDVYVVLLSAYTFTAIMCYLNILSGHAEFTTTTLFPYVYLAICIFISLYPFRNLSFNGNFTIKETSLTKVMMWLYIIAGLFSAIFTIPTTIVLFQSGNWGELREMMYDDPTQVSFYHSQFERVCKNIYGYLEPLGIVMAFYQLSKPVRRKSIVILLFTVWILNTFLGSTIIASRGLIAKMIMEIGLVFVLFKNCINIRTKRYIFIIACVVGFFLISYTLSVSISRFGKDEASDSIFTYLGHSMLAFNQGIMGTMHDYAWGKYFFNYFYALFGFDPTISPSALGITCGTAFVTYVGSLYKDCGPFFTLPVLVVVSRYICKFTRRKQMCFSTLVIIVFSMSFFIDGVFVYGRGEGIICIMAWVVYRIVKFSENQN